VGWQRRESGRRSRFTQVRGGHGAGARLLRVGTRWPGSPARLRRGTCARRVGHGGSRSSSSRSVAPAQCPPSTTSPAATNPPFGIRGVWPRTRTAPVRDSMLRGHLCAALACTCWSTHVSASLRTC
jgi:hypothetical protein